MEDTDLIDGINQIRRSTNQHQAIFRNLKHEMGEQTREVEFLILFFGSFKPIFNQN